MKNPQKATLRPTKVKVDKSLDKYLDKGLFQEKVDKANHVLATVGLPKFAEK